jgi:hypothetical protein
MAGTGRVVEVIPERYFLTSRGHRTSTLAGSNLPRCIRYSVGRLSFTKSQSQFTHSGTSFSQILTLYSLGLFLPFSSLINSFLFPFSFYPPIITPKTLHQNKHTLTPLFPTLTLKSLFHSLSQSFKNGELNSFFSITYNH